MGTLVSYRLQGVSSNSTPSTTMVDISSYQPSGYIDGNLLGVAMWDYDYTNKQWVPHTHT